MAEVILREEVMFRNANNTSGRYPRWDTSTMLASKLIIFAGISMGSLAAFSLLTCSVTLNAQVLQGSLTGAVTDSSGAVVPGAAVSVVSPSTASRAREKLMGLASIPSAIFSPGSTTDSNDEPNRAHEGHLR